MVRTSLILNELDQDWPGVKRQEVQMFNNVVLDALSRIREVMALFGEPIFIGLVDHD